MDWKWTWTWAWLVLRQTKIICLSGFKITRTEMLLRHWQVCVICPWKRWVRGHWSWAPQGYHKKRHPSNPVRWDYFIIRTLSTCDLIILELAILFAVDQWSYRQCRRLHLSVTADNKRFVLGDARFLVRYLTITSEQVWSRNLSFVKYLINLIISLELDKKGQNF